MSTYRQLATQLHFDGAGSRLVVVFILACALLAGCADDESDRQFAGDEQETSVAEETPTQLIATSSPASPEPVASPLTEDELLAARGDQEIATLVDQHKAYLLDLASERLTTLDTGGGTQAWLADVAPDHHHVAVLVSPEGSLVHWTLHIFDRDGERVHQIPVVGGDASPVAPSDVVATATGGIDWSPDGKTIAVALPTGGIYAVTLDGSVEQMSPPRRAARPGDVAWSPNGRALAFASQPNAKSGFGVSLASTSAFPLDAVSVLKPDPTGNRSVSGLEWTSDGSHIVAIVDRRETGGSRGDVFAIPTEGGTPVLLWSAGPIATSAGAEHIALSPDGEILAVVIRTEDGGSAVVFSQLGGPSQIQRDLESALEAQEVLWTDQGLVVLGAAEVKEGAEPLPPLVIRLDERGEIELIGPSATPAASPEPIGSPKPVGSPGAPGSPEASPVGSPSPVASPATAVAGD